MPNRPKSKPKIMSEEETSPQSPDINIGDFNAILQIIDVASSRGAFKGEELSSIGTVRDRVNAFVTYHTPKTGETEKETATPGAEVTEETSE
jgi:hypothetical protein